MDKIMIKCIRCGKEIKLDLSDSKALCKKCRKIKPEIDIKTTKNFNF